MTSPSNQPVKLPLAAIILLALLPGLSATEPGNLIAPVNIPIIAQGKEIGHTTLPTGTKVDVVRRDRAKTLIKTAQGEIWADSGSITTGRVPNPPQTVNTPAPHSPEAFLAEAKTRIQFTSMNAKARELLDIDHSNMEWSSGDWLYFSSIWTFAPCSKQDLKDIEVADLQVDFVRKGENAKIQSLFDPEKRKRLPDNRDLNAIPVRVNQIILAKRIDTPNIVYVLRLIDRSTGRDEEYISAEYLTIPLNAQSAQKPTPIKPVAVEKGSQRDHLPGVPEQAINAYIAALTAADTAALEAILTKNPSMAAYIWKPKGYAVKVNGLMFLLDSAPADRKRIEATKILISKGVDPKFEWNRDMSDHDTTRSNLVSYPEHLQIEELEMLLKNGADPNFPVCVPGSAPIGSLTNTYLQGNGDKEKVKAKILVMLKYGADPSQRSLLGGKENSLEAAQKANATELLEILTTKR